MKLKLFTYNTLLSDAEKGLSDIFEKSDPDIVLLQEIDTSTDTLRRIESLGYKLADYSNGFIKYGKVYGVATFYKADRLRFQNSSVIFLPSGLAETITFILRIFRTRKKERTVLKTDFIHKSTGAKISIFNIHLSAHGTNGIRIKQIIKTLQSITTNSTQSIILAGDFNYPIGRKKLEELMTTYEFKEATKTVQYTSEGKTPHYSFIEKLIAKFIFSLIHNKLKLDYIFYKNLTWISTKTMNVTFSDHYPVIAEFEISPILLV